MTLNLRELPRRSSKLVDLNLLKVRISSNLPEFDAYAYFSREVPPTGADEPADYEIHCVDLDRDPFDTEELQARADRTLRAKRFKAGYYLNHIFGAPAHLITEGHRSYVFGHRLERTVWPYFVKRILTDFAVDHGYLHLKAGGFTFDDGSATLLVGPNGGGKTVFLTQACRAGARFLTNTHVLVRDGVAFAVPSAVRIRRDPHFDELIERHRLTPHVESGDHLAAPELLFPGTPADTGRIRNIVITDHNPAGHRGFERISPDQTALFLDQFASAVTNYGLKDDLLAHFGGDFEKFTGALGTMKNRLAELVARARCFRANVDMLDPSRRSEVLAALAAGPAG
ncbi:FomB family phosphonate monophosphate kinase [Streptomyces sp. S3(2020)]|uniref:FomB family phosphonate monophosphate kinase n=1 Tax=Streptomyces sp. S3(2020) TaxID=2732044 RepID=UPI0014899961|nr:FomB family phosphonate monophosphate kinase [Streptomyces sp. S3(2020)]NNN29653.1 FomB family phosphonate monophosphate kinase [Streptomyces sp. S3(2020)]